MLHALGFFKCFFLFLIIINLGLSGGLLSIVYVILYNLYQTDMDHLIMVRLVTSGERYDFCTKLTLIKIKKLPLR